MADSDHMPMHSTFMDYPEHERTYGAFVFFAKYGTAAVALVVILMAFFLL